MSRTKTLIIASLVATGALFAAGAAQARSNVSWSIGINAPIGPALNLGTVVSGGPGYGYYGAAPVYSAPVYSAPAYVAPPSYYYPAAPVVYAPRPYYRAAPVYIGYDRGYYGRGYDRHDRRDDRRDGRKDWRDDHHRR